MEKHAPTHRSTSADWLKSFGLPTALVIAGFLIAYQFVDPAPPDHLVIAAGQPGGAYAAHADRYREFLARHGIALEVLHTAGSVENLRLLAAGEADVGFVQGGTAGPYQDSGLESLGSLYYEPLWVFHRADLRVATLRDLAGRRLALGPEGSGTRALALSLLADNDLLGGGVEDVALGGEEAAQALTKGEVDAAFLVAGPSSPVVRELMGTHGIALMHFRRADAYTRRHGYLSEAVLPEGLIDLGANVPAREVHLLAAAANLVASPEAHPALLDLLLQAMDATHTPGDWFAAHERFPAANLLVLPLSADAKRFYEHGPPLLQRYLPFWAATLIDRLKVMLLPLVMLLVPLAKVMPPLYRWRMRARIFRWYRDLDAVEARAQHIQDPAERAALHAELDRVEDDVRAVHVPLSFASQAYDLRMHVALVRRSLER
jgi:TRAP transporter TAXI family solute receptor